MASKDDDFNKEDLEAFKGDEEESFLEERKQKKEAENVGNQKVVRGDIDLLGDGITYLDPEYDEKFQEMFRSSVENNLDGEGGTRDDINLLGDGITWYDPGYDERLGEIRFYDQSHAKADYEHWGKVPLWSSADAAALLFGKDPQIVTPDSIQPYIQSPGFPKKYMQMYTLIDRAVSAGELRSNSNLINPTDLLKWARQKQLDIPKELIDAVERDSICTKTEESAANQLERDPNAMAASRRETDLDGDGITWIDKEYDEKLREASRPSNDIDLRGDGITWLDPEYDERLNNRDVDLEGDGITWYDSEYDERMGEVPFYEKPNAVADYELWGQIALWSSAESAALILEKDPQLVTPDSIEPYKERDGFPKKYTRIYLLIDRAIIAGELESEKGLIKPVDLIEWAKQKQIDIPTELNDAIEGGTKNTVIAPISDVPAQNDQTATLENPFPAMDDLQWKEINMIFVSDEAVRLKARDKSLLVTYAELGFKNKRDAKPSLAWEAMLNQFANTKTGLKKDYDPNLKSRVKEIRKGLKNYFQIKDDPFLPFKDGGWIPKIRIHDKRGSIDYPFEHEGDAADQWLRDND
ncbi:MAG: hypothetical protein JAZ13_07755 [Candidatus Thiodiazotropha taylori]|nr:hypothetical protein [Candidatus Thiodiazotropha taylori]